MNADREQLAQAQEALAAAKGWIEGAAEQHEYEGGKPTAILARIDNALAGQPVAPPDDRTVIDADEFEAAKRDPKVAQLVRDADAYLASVEPVTPPEADPSSIEFRLRKEWWGNHGHAFWALYGDDGEMQCSQCPADFKRQPIEELAALVGRSRLAAVSSPVPAEPEPTDA